MAANKSEKPRRQRYTSLKGESLFAHVVDVDYGTEQYPDPKGSYNITLALDADDAAALDILLADEVEDARAYADKKFEELKPAAKKKFGSASFNEPGPEEYDREGNPTGRRLFRFKTAAFYEKRDGTRQQRRVPLFDAMQQPVSLKEEPGNGSLIRVAFTAAPYFVDGQGMGGLSLYLDAVQIIKLNKYGGRNAADYGFGAEDGGFCGDDDATDAGNGVSPAAAPTSPVDDDDDGVPF